MSLHDELLGILTAHDAEREANLARAQAAEGEVAELLAEVAALEARVRELEAQVPDPDPEPEPDPDPGVTVFGADATGTSGSAQATVIGKWGQGVAIRQFFTGLGQIASRNPDAGIVHCSWKPASVSAITPTAVAAAVANLRPGDCVEVWHESDKKVRDGVYTFDEALRRKNRFYDVIQEVRPDLLVVNTLTGWEAEPGNTSTRGNIDKWAGVKADLLGLDCDGIHGFPYPNYTSEIDTAVEFLEDFPAYKGWCVPEFGTSRSSQDPTGSARADWATNYANKFLAAGAHYVCLYEYESTTGNAFTTTAEINAWRSFTAR